MHSRVVKGIEYNLYSDEEEFRKHHPKDRIAEDWRGAQVGEWVRSDDGKVMAMVLDEPTTGLDPQARHLVWALINGLKRSGKTIILTTHYLEEAERLCDNLVLIDHGYVVARGTTKELIATHCEKTVLEIRNTLDPLQKLTIQNAATRLEYSGDTTYAYADDPTALTTAIDRLGLEQVLHRHATLEDVFLRLTGRGIRD